MVNACEVRYVVVDRDALVLDRDHCFRVSMRYWRDVGGALRLAAAWNAEEEVERLAVAS